MLLKPLKFVAYRPLATLNFAFLTFLRRSTNSATFGDHLFPKRFRSYINDKDRRSLKAKFQEVHQALHHESCTEADRQRAAQCAAAFRRIEQFCAETTTTLPDFHTLPIALKSALKDFAIHLYENVLNSPGFRSGFGGGLDGHYQALLDRNGNLQFCPFCFHQPYPAMRSEADYDHFLNKVDYPLAAINLRNLVPMCQPCNKTHKKQKDVLKLSATQRRTVFYPYSPTCPAIEIEIALQERPGGNWTVDLQPTDSQRTELVETWKDVFDIVTRYQGEIKKQQAQWWKSFRRDKGLLGNSQPMDVVRNAIRDYRVENQSGNLIPLNDLRLAFFGYLEQASESEIRGRLMTNPDAY